ncbi:sensor domain-containing diguanylate cyclase [Pseudoteredinibacter isoporae]|uniref:Diguanylate cyclase (GGDEF)-like protein/PAS domain S-box-containing protein n=1 Tax=Pseudoteredinibacter isoporae TaxID=570281 RepID=A0A7X0MX01_9GAMM|nr:sensor domain-containing diguanylate cyclase [Pseudoteredinibacter isoporae]MBB6522765.1 diguanylate cyclase (GGDEF)-like protein/PAS domain S-box-containing protein [Pseudoteredinibacter isoporae]NHO88293.1 diguanylate cyclase [Pseudoteredinibacter isoporae]NIB23376.1 diguanylate cyclase [Pseudoteredinibacter isoporae]
MIFLGSHSDINKQLDAIGTPVAIWQQSDQGSYTLISANNLYQQVLDGSIERQLGKDLQTILPRYIMADIKSAIASCCDDMEAREVEVAIERHGQTCWWRFIYAPLNGPENIRVLNTCIDISEKKRLEHNLQTSMRRFEAVINTAYDGIITIDDEQNIKMFNKAAGEMFDHDPEAALGMSLTQLMPERYRGNHSGHVEGFSQSPTLSRPMHTRASVMGLRRDGSEFPLEITISKIQVGSNSEMTAVLRDISERALLIEELRQAATIDPLTGIFNRRYFSKQLKVERKRCQRFGHNMSLIMFDVDHFKSINDEHGHSEGDRLLKEISEAVGAQLRDVDIFARWGGDEFIILLPETGLHAASEVAKKISTSVSLPAFPISLSLGVVSTDGEQSSCDILDDVDSLMYTAKKAGRNQVVASESNRQ